MMVRGHIVHSASGRIVSTFTGLATMAAVNTPAEHVFIENADQAVSDVSHWAPEGTVAVRPTPSAPPTLAAGTTSAWAGLPPGAEVRVIDPGTGLQAGSSVADAQGVLSIALPAGPWRIEVAEAFPWTAASFDIEV